MPGKIMGFSAFVGLLALHSCCMSLALQTISTPSSLFTNTKWKISLDVGLQQGTWMPKRFPGWAESGARLGLDVEVEFTEKPSATRESLVGPKDATFQLRVCSPSGESTFVSERGQEKVVFMDGGWCIERPTGNIKNGRGSLVKPEGLLKFWLDCPTGAKRRDVEIRPSTRIFFTTGVWDDPQDVKYQDGVYRDVLKKLQDVVDRARDEESKRVDGGQNLVEEFQSFSKMTGDAKEFDRLKERKLTLERELPPTGASTASTGVQIAPTGSLVIKGNNIPDWLPGSEYLILGTFSTSAIGDD